MARAVQVVLVIIVLGSCAHNRWAPIGSFPTILVTNSLLDPVRVYATEGPGGERYVGATPAGETRCLRLPLADVRYRLEARSSAGVIASAMIRPDRPGMWGWEVRAGLHSSGDLAMLTREPCQ